MNSPFVDARKMNGETLELLKEYYPNNARNLFSAFIVLERFFQRELLEIAISLMYEKV